MGGSQKKCAFPPECAASTIWRAGPGRFSSGDTGGEESEHDSVVTERRATTTNAAVRDRRVRSMGGLLEG
jgi:hypothetical protein